MKRVRKPLLKKSVVRRKRRVRTRAISPFFVVIFATTVAGNLVPRNGTSNFVAEVSVGGVVRDTENFDNNGFAEINSLPLPLTQSVTVRILDGAGNQVRGPRTVASNRVGLIFT